MRFEFCQTTQFIEHRHRPLKPRADVAVGHLQPGRQLMPHTPEQGFHLFRGHARVEHLQEVVEDRGIRLGKQTLGFWRQAVGVGRLALTAPHPLLHQPVPLKRREMRPHRIVGEFQRLRQLVHGTVGPPQPRNVAAGAGETGLSRYVAAIRSSLCIRV